MLLGFLRNGFVAFGKSAQHDNLGQPRTQVVVQILRYARPFTVQGCLLFEHPQFEAQSPERNITHRANKQREGSDSEPPCLPEKWSNRERQFSACFVPDAVTVAG